MLISKENGFIQVKVKDIKLFPMYIYNKGDKLEVWSVPLGRHSGEGPSQRKLAKGDGKHWFEVRSFARFGRNHIYEICVEDYLKWSQDGQVIPELANVGLCLT